MKRAIKLNRCALLCQPHLNLTQPFFISRLKSDSSKSSATTKKETECKSNKDAAPDKTTKDASAGKPPKDAAASKPAKEAEPEKDAPPPKDETTIAGGSKCSPKTPPAPPQGRQSAKANKELCESFFNPKPSNASKKNVSLTKIQGGAIECKKNTVKKPKHANHATQFQKLSLFLVLPLVAILTLLVFTTRMEEDRLEFKNYTYMYKRDKRFSWRDGKRSAFHNSYYNALAPDGYEDEIDEEGLDAEPETEQDKKSRLKEFEKVFKKWKKHADKRNAQAQKQMAAAQ